MLNRLLPLSGTVFVALTVVAFGWLGGNTPGGKDSAAKVTSFYLAHHARESAAAYVICIAVAFLVLFVVSAWRQTGALSLWHLVFVAGGTVAAVGFLAAGAIHLALSEGINDGIGSSAALALNALDANDYLPFSIGIAVMLLGAAGLAIPRRGPSGSSAGARSFWRWRASPRLASSPSCCPASGSLPRASSLVCGPERGPPARPSLRRRRSPERSCERTNPWRPSTRPEESCAREDPDDHTRRGCCCCHAARRPGLGRRADHASLR